VASEGSKFILSYWGTRADPEKKKPADGATTEAGDESMRDGERKEDQSKSPFSLKSGRTGADLFGSLDEVKDSCSSWVPQPAFGEPDPFIGRTASIQTRLAREGNSMNAVKGQ